VAGIDGRELVDHGGVLSRLERRSETGPRVIGLSRRSI
jgi:hypothetical protein